MRASSDSGLPLEDSHPQVVTLLLAASAFVPPAIFLFPLTDDFAASSETATSWFQRQEGHLASKLCAMVFES